MFLRDSTYPIIGEWFIGFRISMVVKFMPSLIDGLAFFQHVMSLSHLEFKLIFVHLKQDTRATQARMLLHGVVRVQLKARA